eukprot:GHVO01063428.1.p1 GENE.GHVO01063428.1~~GHVO01063428.1.p1  ORF type:complete len:298 (+),score=57.79 GHVO01063428.1:83-976(+)
MYALCASASGTQPIIFDQRHANIPLNLRSCPNTFGVHVIIFVHGFQGNSFDLRLFRNVLSLYYPALGCYCSTSNEDDTEGDIGEMGKRLANEVKKHLGQWYPGEALGGLSFVAHSMGGLIVRAALPFLIEFSPKFHLYMSLSSPHLGYMQNSSRVVEMGIWVLKKIRNSLSLKQLTMSDHKHIQSTFLHRLSKAPGLSSFRCVVLLSSAQDQYVPFDSARIEFTTTDFSTRFGAINEMARSIMANVDFSKLLRLDVNFRIPGGNLDAIIGRTAHIHFLESYSLFEILAVGYKKLFKL